MATRRPHEHDSTEVIKKALTRTSQDAQRYARTGPKVWEDAMHQIATAGHGGLTMTGAGTSLWNVQKWDQRLGTYSNPEAAKAHGDHVIHDHYRHHMDRHRVPDSHRIIDWRVDCCGHLYGPGQFNHVAYPETHADGCWRQKSGLLILRPFWAANGTKVGTGHVSTDWEIWQGVALDQFDPSTAA